MEGLREKIEFVHALRNFGEAELGLQFGEAFKNFEPDHPLVNWLYASPRYSIQSIFDYFGRPFLNCLMTDGYADTFRELQKNLEALNFDTYLYAAEAWGGRRCPILPVLLGQPMVRQAYVVLHEGLHITRSLKTANIPYELEEPAAVVIADVGILAFAEATGNRELLRNFLLMKVFRKKFEQAAKVATRMLTEKYEEIAEKSDEEREAEREKLFGIIRADPIWRDAEETGVTTVGDINRAQTINNAFFVRCGAYYTHLSLVEAAAKQFADAPEAVNFFLSLPQELDQAIEQLKRKTEIS